VFLSGNSSRFLSLLRPFVCSLNPVIYYSSLTHVGETGKASMVDVSSKPESLRIALAQAEIIVRLTQYHYYQCQYLSTYIFIIYIFPYL